MFWDSSPTLTNKAPSGGSKNKLVGLRIYDYPFEYQDSHLCPKKMPKIMCVAQNFLVIQIVTKDSIKFHNYIVVYCGDYAP